MKILHISHSNLLGGAANYVDRVILSHEQIKLENTLLASSLKKSEYNSYLVSPLGSKSNNFFKAKAAQTFDSKIKLLEISSTHRFKSPNLIGAIKASTLNESKGDLVHLYWINGGLISIKQIGKIQKPIVWTLLDMWPFLGSEHYLLDSDTPRFIEGYNKSNRNSDSKGIDLCRLVWQSKKKHFKKLHLVSPSKWLAREAQKSALFSEIDIEIIPPPIDSTVFRPLDKILARSNLGINNEKFTIGYLGGISSRKGWDFIKELCNYPELNSNWQFLLGGASKDAYSNSIKIKNNVSIVGYLDKSEKLIDFYSSIDVLLVPSTSEAYGLVAQEAQTTGVPVIVFKDTGAEDVVIHGSTGLVCAKRSTLSLFQAIESLYLEEFSKKLATARFSRERAKKEWSMNVIGNRYLEMYTSILAKDNS